VTGSRSGSRRGFGAQAARADLLARSGASATREGEQRGRPVGAWSAGGAARRVFHRESDHACRQRATRWNESFRQLNTEITETQWQCLFVDSCRQAIDYDDCHTDASYFCD
jgi:hypothetical protein